jgi:hypothetical protein
MLSYYRNTKQAVGNRHSSLLLIVFLGLTLIALSLVSMWKESRHGQPLKGIIWFSLAVIGFCVVVALLADTFRRLDR